MGKRHNCATEDDFYAAIGYGGIQLWKVLPRIKEEAQRLQKSASPDQPQELPPPTTPEPKGRVASGVLVDGMDNCLIKFSRCCNPLPGDEIIGFITRGFGVSIHKRSCSNVPPGFDPVPRAGAVGQRPLGRGREGRLQVHLAHFGGGPGAACWPT